MEDITEEAGFEKSLAGLGGAEVGIPDGRNLC